MKKKYSLQKGIEIMLEFSKDNPDIKLKSKFMAKLIRRFIKERSK